MFRRAVAYDIGRRAAHEVMTRHAQEHGDWPRASCSICGAAPTIRTGGEDFAQALALLGVIPLWDNATARRDRLRDRADGQTRFPARRRDAAYLRDCSATCFRVSIALFHDAVSAVAALDEERDANPLTQFRGRPLDRIFGAAPGAYGLGLGETISRGSWKTREELGAAFLDAGGHAYDRAGDGAPARETFAARVARRRRAGSCAGHGGGRCARGSRLRGIRRRLRRRQSRARRRGDAVHLDATRPENLRAALLA